MVSNILMPLSHYLLQRNNLSNGGHNKVFVLVAEMELSRIVYGLFLFVPNAGGDYERIK